MSSKPLTCFMCKETILFRDKHNHMSTHFSDPHQYLTFKKCTDKKHISYYRFKRFRCRFCVHLHRSRFGHN